MAHRHVRTLRALILFTALAGAAQPAHALTQGATAARHHAALILAVPLSASSPSSYRVQLYRRLAGGAMCPLYHPFTTTDGSLAVAGIALSDDGRWLSYSDSVMHVHLVALPHGSDRVIGRGLDPQFSPDRRYLAFLTHNTPGLLADGLMVYTLRSHVLSHAGQPHGALLNSVAWSPRGDRLAWQIEPNRPNAPFTIGVASAAQPHHTSITTPSASTQLSGVAWSADGRSLLLWSLAAMGNTPGHALPLFVLLRQPLPTGPARVVIPATPVNWIEGIPPAPALNPDGTLIASLLGGPKRGLNQLVFFRPGRPAARSIALPGEPRQVAYDPAGSPRLVTAWNAYRAGKDVRRATLVDTASGQTRDLGPAVAAFWIRGSSQG